MFSYYTAASKTEQLDGTLMQSGETAWMVESQPHPNEYPFSMPYLGNQQSLKKFRRVCI
jgi:hypothetical protein